MPALVDAGYCAACLSHADRLTSGARLCHACAGRIRRFLVVLVAALGLILWALAWPAFASDGGAVSPARPTVVLRAGDPAPWSGFLVDRATLDQATMALEVQQAPCPPHSDRPFPWALCGALTIGALGVGVGVGAIVR